MHNSLSQKQTTAVVIGAIVIAVAFFFIGFAVGHHGSSSKAGAYGRTGMMGGAGGFGAGGGTMRARTGGFTNGTILSMTSTSITVSLQNGGSQTIYFTPTTPVLKSVTGTSADLKVGDAITATGTPNADGSIAAQSVTIRPAGMAPMGGAAASSGASAAPMIPAQ